MDVIKRKNEPAVVATTACCESLSSESGRNVSYAPRAPVTFTFARVSGATSAELATATRPAPAARTAARRRRVTTEPANFPDYSAVIVNSGLLYDLPVLLSPRESGSIVSCETRATLRSPGGSVSQAGKLRKRREVTAGRAPTAPRTLGKTRSSFHLLETVKEGK